jgi:hypothetical protein
MVAFSTKAAIGAPIARASMADAKRRFGFMDESLLPGRMLTQRA